MFVIYLKYENGNDGYLDPNGELIGEWEDAWQLSQEDITMVWSTIETQGLKRLEIKEVDDDCLLD